MHASIIAPKLPNIEFVLSDMAEDYFEHIKENVKSIDNVLLPRPVAFGQARDDIVDALIVDNLNAVIRGVFVSVSGEHLSHKSN